MKLFVFILIAQILLLSILTTLGKPSSSSSLDKICDGVDSGLFPNPDDCSTFIQCSFGRVYLQPCPQAAPCYNPGTHQCTYTHSCSCKGRPAKN